MTARPGFSLLLWIAFACSPGEAPPEPAPEAARVERPNLVLVIGDDHGYRDFGFMGSPVAQTPNLDRLAAEGIAFRVGYSAASVCRPSLRALLTGLHPAQLAEREHSRVPTLPQALAGAGYATFRAGKSFAGDPTAAGFTEFMRGDPVRRDLAPVLAFIDRNRDRPFFLWFAPKLPHRPFDAPPEFNEAYRGANLSANERGYFANVSRFDAGVGRLLEHLDKRDLRRRTLIVYLSDNGFEPVESVTAPDRADPLGRRVALNRFSFGGPRGKASLYEAGFRTPVVASWPGVIPQGRLRDDLVSSVDLVPTLLAYAGVSPLPGLPGYDLRDAFEGRAVPARQRIVGIVDEVRSDTPAGGALGPERFSGPGAFVRDARWHYLWFFDRREELYDTRADPGETRDLAGVQAQRVTRMRAELLTWMRRHGVPGRRLPERFRGAEPRV